LEKRRRWRRWLDHGWDRAKAWIEGAAAGFDSAVCGLRTKRLFDCLKAPFRAERRSPSRELRATAPQFFELAQSGDSENRSNDDQDDGKSAVIPYSRWDL